MAKILLGISVLLMAITAYFGFSTKSKVVGIRSQNATLTSNLDTKSKALTKAEADIKSAQEQVASSNAKAEVAANDAAAAKADAEAAKKQVSDLQSQSEQNKTEIAKLTDELAKRGTSATGAPAGAELEEKVKEAETKVAELTQVNQTLTARVKEVESEEQSLKQDKERRDRQMMAKGLEGQVLAVNRGWNFVVISIGDRQGVTMNAQMIVKRDDRMVAKVRISSVEPSTSIADVVPGTMAKGESVQPGDRVIYTGS